MKEPGFDAAKSTSATAMASASSSAPRPTSRTDEYGGSLANRMRLPLRVLEAVRKSGG